MSNNVKIANSVIPSKVDTPLDARSRVAYEADMLNIENPAVGQLVYCTSNGKFYVIKTLKTKQIGAIAVQNGAVDTYEELASSGTPSEPGEPGAPGAAAGFGTPTAIANTLDAGSPATVSVTASGDDTDKVFNFVFGIPRGKDGKDGESGKDGEDGKDGTDGADGYTPVRGVDYWTDADIAAIKQYIDDEIINGEY